MTVNCKMDIFWLENTMRTMKYAVKWKMDILKTVKWKKPVFKSVKL